MADSLATNAEIVMGQSPPGDACNSIGDGLPLLNGPTEYGAHHPTPVQFTTQPKKRALKGDLLFCVRGSTTGSMNWADRDYAIGRGLAAIRHRTKPELQPLVRAVIEYGLPGLLAQATGSTFPNVSADQLAKMWWPPIGESQQRAAASILGALDDKIELSRRMTETLEAMARALFKSWFVDFDPVRAKAEGRPTGLSDSFASLFPSSFEESAAGKMPRGWRLEAVGEHLLNFDSQRIPLSAAQRSIRIGPYPYHGAAGVVDAIDEFLFDGIYLLLGEDGSVVTESGLGVTQYVWGKFWVNNHAHVLQGRGAVSTEQLYLYFFVEPVLPYVTGAVQPKLSQGRLNIMPFVFAGDEVCGAFADTVRPWFSRIRYLSDEIRVLSNLRDSLLPRLILGEFETNGRAGAA